MNYKITMEEMRDQLMKTLEKDEGYKIINLLTDEIRVLRLTKILKVK